MSTCNTTKRQINFKHVGFKRSDRKFELLPPPSAPLGIKTPMALSHGKSDLFTMHYSPDNQIQDNLRNLILTNYGERLNRYDYGANLKNLTFDLSSMKDYESQAAIQIKKAVDKFMPIVELQEMTVDALNREFTQATLPPSMAEVLITISYNVPRLKIVGKKLQAVIYAGG